MPDIVDGNDDADSDATIELFEKGKEVAEQLDVELKGPRIVSRQTNRANNQPAQSAEEYFRRAIYIPLLDCVVNDLQERLSPEVINVFQLGVFLPKVNYTNEDLDTVKQPVLNYELLIDNTPVQVVMDEYRLWMTKWQMIPNIPQTVPELIEKCDIDMYPNIRKFLLHYQKRDEGQWLKWYNEIESEEEEVYAEEDSEDNEEVEVEIQDENTDHELDADPDYGDGDKENEFAVTGPHFVGKNGIFKWNKMKPPASRTKAHNMILKVPGPVGAAKSAKSYMECFYNFIDDSMFEMIVENTNLYISHMQEKFVAMGTYEAEQARLERLMYEEFDEEGLDDTDEEFINEELDVFETREEDSESEQDLSDREDLTEEDSNKPYYLGKPSKNKPNDAIRWFKHPSNQNEKNDILKANKNLLTQRLQELDQKIGEKSPKDKDKVIKTFSDTIKKKVNKTSSANGNNSGSVAEGVNVCKMILPSWLVDRDDRPDKNSKNEKEEEIHSEKVNNLGVNKLLITTQEQSNVLDQYIHLNDDTNPNQDGWEKIQRRARRSKNNVGESNEDTNFKSAANKPKCYMYIYRVGKEVKEKDIKSFIENKLNFQQNNMEESEQIIVKKVQCSSINTISFIVATDFSYKNRAVPTICVGRAAHDGAVTKKGPKAPKIFFYFYQCLKNQLEYARIKIKHKKEMSNNI
ncbi:hypothetical protein JTB14_030430 [Gonioctena quinquepunctata]|nr:hypothetical protein JTB14_030430 [Gonioctena quinquepunctata]